MGVRQMEQEIKARNASRIAHVTLYYPRDYQSIGSSSPSALSEDPFSIEDSSSSAPLPLLNLLREYRLDIEVSRLEIDISFI